MLRERDLEQMFRGCLDLIGGAALCDRNRIERVFEKESIH